MSQSKQPPRSWVLKTMDKEVYRLTSEQVEKMLEAQIAGVTLIRIGGVVLNSNSISSLYHIKERDYSERVDRIMTLPEWAIKRYQVLIDMTPDERITHFDKLESQGLLKPGGTGDSEDLLPDNDKARLARPETKRIGTTAKQGS